MLLFTQYTHPGGTHDISVNERKTMMKEWNYKNGHRQKFINAIGDCITPNDEVLYNQNCLFWNEWEPTSVMREVKKCIDAPGILPEYVHSPYLEVDENGIAIQPKYNGKTYTSHGKQNPCIRQNTDPFVFDEHFHYCRCKQRTFSTLRKLDKGSIILFGSIVSKQRGGLYYSLDTVFVVEESKPYYAREYKRDLGDFVSNDYAQIIGFEQTEHPEQQFTLYKGANYKNPINGTFSYTPCKLCDGDIVGFPKARLYSDRLNKLFDKQIIQDNLNSSPKYTIIEDPNDCKIIWDEIRNQIEEQGFLLGVKFNYDRHVKENKTI